MAAAEAVSPACQALRAQHQRVDDLFVDDAELAKPHHGEYLQFLHIVRITTQLRFPPLYVLLLLLLASTF
jgi:hypothetical protein